VQIIRRFFTRADHLWLASPSHTVVNALVLRRLRSGVGRTRFAWLEFHFLLWKALLLMLGE
jgi:hypothetical protein